MLEKIFERYKRMRGGHANRVEREKDKWYEKKDTGISISIFTDIGKCIKSD